MGLSRVPLLCAREIPVPGALPRVIRVLIHCYPPEADRARSTLPRRGAQAPAGPRGRAIDCGAMALEFAEQGPPHPGLPGRRRLRVRGRRSRKLASNESPYPPVPAVVEAVTRALSRPQPLSRPDELGAAPPAVRPPRRAGEPDRGRQRLVRHPARRRRRAARAGRRDRLRVAVVLASIRTWRPPPARARSRCRSTPSTATTSRRCGARSPSRRG